MADVTVLTGSHLSDRQAQIETELHEHWGRAVMLLPSLRLVQARRDAYMERSGLAGIIGTPFKTFDQLASEILEHEGRCAETLSDFQRTLLVQEVIAEQRATGVLGQFDAACSTPGFAAHALRIITQLKQAGVDHDEFSRIVDQRNRQGGFDRIVSAIYTGYQQAVIGTGVYDRVGVIWQAETLALERPVKALADIDVVLLDAFDDFTPSERRLIKALTPHVSKIVFGFVFSVEDASQEDLYALPRDTSRRVCDAFGVGFPNPCTESEPPTFAAFAAQHVFWRSKPSNAPKERNLSLIEYRDAWNEIEATGRAIKSLVLDGADPASIAVLHRNIADAALAIRCVFTEFGIPCTLTAAAPLRDSSLAAFAVELIEATDAWERDRVAAVLSSPWFARAAQEGFDAAATFSIARAAGVIEGHRDWSRGLEALRDRLTQSDRITSLHDRIGNPGQACEHLLSAVAQLHEIAAAFPAKAPEVRYIEALIALLDALGLDEVVPHLPEPIASQEAPAIERFYELLRKWHAWSAGRTGAAPIARAEFVTRLRRALRDTLRGTPHNHGGVWCASMDEARHLEFDHVFLIGMNEGTVPRPAPVNAIYSQSDLEAFSEYEIELDTHQRHTESEMLLLHRSMCAAKVQLTVSWHAVDPGGKPRAPSPFVEDIKSVVPEGIDVVSGGAAYPSADVAASRRDLAAALPAEAAQSVLDAVYAARIDAGARIEMQRYGGTPFDRYDGIVGDDAVKHALANRFGSTHTFSVNQFEAYASCPFRFYMERILAVPEDLAPEAAIDARDRGDALHRILRAFHERFKGKHVADLNQDEWSAALDECIDAVFEPLERYGSPYVRALWRVERIRTHTRLRRYVLQTIEKDDSRWKPFQFEVAFGRVQPDADTGQDRLQTFELATEAGPIKFSGKIDRIDRADDSVRIVDYKSSLTGMTKKKVASAESLQLPVYGMAWDSVHEDTPCVEASFVQIGAHKKYDAFTDESGDWRELADAVRARIGELANRIRDGHFPPDADKGGCYACKARRACRYEQSRIERKRTAGQ